MSIDLETLAVAKGYTNASIASFPPKIDPTTKHWIVWNQDSMSYVDSGIIAEGSSEPTYDVPRHNGWVRYNNITEFGSAGWDLWSILKALPAQKVVFDAEIYDASYPSLGYPAAQGRIHIEYDSSSYIAMHFYTSTNANNGSQKCWYSIGQKAVPSGDPKWTMWLPIVDTVFNTTGNSPTLPMSQAAITTELNKKEDKITPYTISLVKAVNFTINSTGTSFKNDVATSSTFFSADTTRYNAMNNKQIRMRVSTEDKNYNSSKILAAVTGPLTITPFSSDNGVSFSVPFIAWTTYSGNNGPVDVNVTIKLEWV